MEPEVGDDRTAPSRPRFSRAFAQAGFSRVEAERWRQAGWDDAAEAAEWRPLSHWRSPEDLRRLADAGADPRHLEVELDLRDQVLENLRRPYV